MAYSLSVRQHEIIIVQGAESQNFVFDLFTTGMNPCIGFVLWHPKFCALAHVDEADDIPQFAPVIEKFAGHCQANSNSVPKPFALVVMAHGVGGSFGWYSESMKVDIEKLCKKSNVAVDVARPMKPEESAMVMVNVSNGARGYDFPPNKAGVHIQRNPGAEAWVRNPIGSVFRFGFFVGKNGQTASVDYVKGSDTQAVTEVLAKQG